jgi:hypothetical protein
VSTPVYSPRDIVQRPRTLIRIDRLCGDGPTRGPLFGKCSDVGCDVFRFVPRQRHIHPRVRIEDRIGEHFCIEPELPRDSFERRRIGQFLRLVRDNDMTEGAPRLRYAFAVVGIGRERALRPEGRSKDETTTK